MANKHYEWKLDISAGTATKTWADGEVSSIDLNELEPSIVTALALHGVKQKGDDAHSGKVAEGIEAMREYTDDVFDALKEGVFRRRREGGPKEPKGSDFDTLVRAVAALKEVDTVKASGMIAHMRPQDETDIPDDKERAKENRKRGAARRKLAGTKEVEGWLKEQGIIKEESLDDALNLGDDDES